MDFGAREEDKVEDRSFDRIGALGAAVVAALSIVYAIAYLGITPAAQRGSHTDAFFRSYLAHPTGLRIASTCLLVSGLVVGFTVVALAGRLATSGRRGLAWASIAGVVGGLATAAHGFGDLVGVDKLAHQYGSGDAATRAAVTVAHVTPSAVDTRGLATFGVAGLVALVFGLTLRSSRPRLGTLGVVLGVDLVALFVATAIGLNALVLVTGGLASVVLGPLWWFGVARWLWRAEDGRQVTEPSKAMVESALVQS